MNSSAPRVSVVTATYNRSNVLRYAIESVRASTLTDWEHIIIGDACTDDTAEVVASFQEPRLRFKNLEKNVGEQSGPNNVGCEMARGKYIAFLNHDDLYLPHHLETAVRALERENADLVYSLKLTYGVKQLIHLRGAAPLGRYVPNVYIEASQWVFRRELVQEIGPWRYFREIYLPPSQDWLIRAWRAKKKIWCFPRVGVLGVPSGGRKNVYLNREEHEQRALWERIQRGDCFEQELTEIAWRATVAATGADLKVLPLVSRALLNVYYRIGYAFGLSFMDWHYRLEFGRKGAFVDRLRATRGLPRKE